MKLLSSLLLLLTTSATLCLAEEAKPNLDDPATLEKIVEKAIDGDMLEKRTVDGHRLSFARNSETPYSGWVKLLHGNAQVRWLGKYKDGKAIGLITVWYEHLQKQRETMLKNGKQIWFRTWYTDGQKAREVHYNDDKPWSAKTWKPDGTPCPDTDLKDGNGALFQYYDNGQKAMEENFINGNEDGNNRSWNENGQKIYESPRKDGKAYGTTTTWYENGQKRNEINYKEGQKHGLLTTWDKEGNITSQIRYKNGKQVEKVK